MGQVQGTERPASLADLLHGARVPWEDLHRRYDPLLRLVDALLGVVPNCDPYLEIWPPAFRTYNVMVPNLLNLPVPVFGIGGPPPGTVGLSMYVSSRSAECGYCTAHSCSFAMRRGASAQTLAAALVPERTGLGPGELATVAVAAGLGRIPSELTLDQKTALIAAYGERKAEWIALAAVMMGFLNKFMDSVGVELEQPVIDEVAATMGPAVATGHTPPVDSLRSRLRVVPLLPAAIRYDRRAQQGIPTRRTALHAHLKQHIGHDFPVLGQVHSRRAARAIGTMLCMNLDPATTVVGLPAKISAGLVFAAVTENQRLLHDLRALARHHDVDPAASVDPVASAVLVLARAAAYSPARIGADTVRACDGVLPPAAVIEVVTWLAVLQLLHRLMCWIEPTA